jgi:hypothetical protein
MPPASRLLLCQYHVVFVTMALWYNLKSGIVIPPALLYLLRIIFAMWGVLCVHLNFRIDFSILAKNDSGVLMGIILNL